MKATATAFAFGLAVPAEAQTVPPAPAVPIVEVVGTAPPAPFDTVDELIAVHNDRIESATKNLPAVMLRRQQVCNQGLSDAIVVCARPDNERYRLRPLPPIAPIPTFMEDLTRALTVHIGPITISPGGGKKGVGFSIGF